MEVVKLVGFNGRLADWNNEKHKLPKVRKSIVAFKRTYRGPAATNVV